MEQASSAFRITLHQDKLRDGRYGPVFLAMKDSGGFVTAELLEEPGTPRPRQAMLSNLDRMQVNQGHPQLVSYLGHQQHEGKDYILTEHLGGGTLQQFVRDNGALPQPLVRQLLRQIVLGLAQLQQQGIDVSFLDSRHVLMSHTGAAKVEAPLLDVTIGEHTFPPAIISLPEVISGQRNMRKADVWLLGVVAAELLSGNGELATSSSMGVASQVKLDEGSAWDLWVPQSVAKKLDEQALDFLRRCFSINIDRRPSIADLLEHPFLSVVV